jgi:hypothetical protein
VGAVAQHAIVPSASEMRVRSSIETVGFGLLIEILFIKFSLASRADQTKLSPLEGRARPRALPRPLYTPPPCGAVERSARAWSPALQAGPVLIRQFHPSPRTRGREGPLR